MNDSRLTLKHPSGFFAAGCEMTDALTLAVGRSLQDLTFTYVSARIVTRPSCAFAWRNWPAPPATARAR